MTLQIHDFLTSYYGLEMQNKNHTFNVDTESECNDLYLMATSLSLRVITNHLFALEDKE